MKVSANKGEINSVCKISKVVVGGAKGIKGGGQSGAISGRKHGRKRHLCKEIGLSTEVGKRGKLPSLASELGVFSF